MYQEFSTIYDEKIREDFNYGQMSVFVRQMMDQQKIDCRRMLDMGCGTGNASLELIRDFEETILCDPSENMLSLAREKYKPPYMPVFLQGRAAEFRMKDRFDLILSVLDVPNYLLPSEFSSYLENCRASLRQGGLLIFDISSEFKLRTMAQKGIYICDEDDYFYVWENHLEEDRLCMEINFFQTDDHSGLYRRTIEEQTMQIMTTAETEKTVQDHGFQILGLYSGYQSVPVDSKTDRIVFVLKKE